MEERRTLESWKAISSCLGRTEKTCRKWEHELGLPVHRLDDSAKAHVFAYADEIDRWKEKVEETKDRKGGKAVGLLRLPRRTRISLAAGLALILVAVAGFLVWRFALRAPAPGRAPARKGIAILAFTDLSPKKEYEYLCDGMAETLIDALNKVEGLRVPSRTSAFFFKGKDVSLREIGEKLNVDFILEASVQADGDKLRVIPRLLNAADGFQLWSEKFDRSRSDIFAVEDDIARMVVDNLKVKLMAGERGRLVKPGTTNLEAHNLYLKGRYLWGKRGFADVSKAVEYFEKAVGLDPRYARGYAGLAMAYLILGDSLYLASQEAYPKAREYAVRALELDDDTAEAHYVLGAVKQFYDWDFVGAEREYKRALELNSGDAFIHQVYAFLLIGLGKPEEAIKEIRLARDLEPTALRVRANVGNILYEARKYDEAEKVLKEEIELDQQNCIVYHYLAAVYGETGRFELALECYRKADECLSPGRSTPATGGSAVNMAGVYARMGKTEEARRILKENEGSSVHYGSRIYPAEAYMWLGDKDKALDLLEKAYAERDAKLIFIAIAPAFDPLRGDPRFQDLLRRIGLEK